MAVGQSRRDQNTMDAAAAAPVVVSTGPLVFVLSLSLLPAHQLGHGNPGRIWLPVKWTGYFMIIIMMVMMMMQSREMGRRGWCEVDLLLFLFLALSMTNPHNFCDLVCCFPPTSFIAVIWVAVASTRPCLLLLLPHRPPGRFALTASLY